MIRLPAYLTGFSSKADGSAALRFATQEVTAEQFALFKESLNSFGWLLFRPNEKAPVDEEIPHEDAEGTEQKRPSQRLRAVLYLIWKKQGGEGDFDVWYRKQMEIIIEKLKTRLD